MALQQKPLNHKSCQKEQLPGADPGLILECCKILQKKMKIEMI